MARSVYTADITRLPVWAQSEIRALLQKVSRLEAQLAERDKYISGQHEGTNVFLGRGIDDPRPLPRNSEVSFQFSDRWDDAISVRHDLNHPKTVYVASLTGRIIISPSSGNSLYLSIPERNSPHA